MDTKEQIRALWVEGLTGTEIGQKLGMTRNAVLGAIYRLRRAGLVDIRDEDKNAVRKQLDGRKRAPKKTRPTKPRVERKPAPPPKLPKLVATEATDLPTGPITPNMVSLFNLKADHCRYAVRGVGAGTFYCGEPKERGSYCAAHGAICYVEPEAHRRKRMRLTRRRQAA